MSRGSYPHDLTRVIERDDGVTRTVVEALVLVEIGDTVPAQNVEVLAVRGSKVAGDGKTIDEEIVPSLYGVGTASWKKWKNLMPGGGDRLGVSVCISRASVVNAAFTGSI